MSRLSERIEVNPDIMLGKPVTKGTLITVESILRKLSQNISTDNILEDYPHLKLEDIQAVLEYAVTSMSMEQVIPFSQTKR